MRRLARNLFTLCSAASLLLGVAVGVLWVRSLGTVDSFEIGALAGRYRATLTAAAGTFRVSWVGCGVRVRWPAWPLQLTRQSRSFQPWEVLRPSPYRNVRARGSFSYGSVPPPTRPFDMELLGRAEATMQQLAGHEDTWRETGLPSPGDGPHALHRRVLAQVDYDLAASRISRLEPRGESIFPAWAAAALLSLLPAKSFASIVRWHRRHRRRVAGRCVACGYDLRASPQRCPECGTPAK